MLPGLPGHRPPTRWVVVYPGLDSSVHHRACESPTRLESRQVARRGRERGWGVHLADLSETVHRECGT